MSGFSQNGHFITFTSLQRCEPLIPLNYAKLSMSCSSRYVCQKVQIIWCIIANRAYQHPAKYFYPSIDGFFKKSPPTQCHEGHKIKRKSFFIALFFLRTTENHCNLSLLSAMDLQPGFCWPAINMVDSGRGVPTCHVGHEFLKFSLEMI